MKIGEATDEVASLMNHQRKPENQINQLRQGIISLGMEHPPGESHRKLIRCLQTLNLSNV